MDAWYGGDKRVAIWAGFSGIVLLLFLAAWELQGYVGKPAAEIKTAPIPTVEAEKPDERPLLVFESVSDNSYDWRQGRDAFEWKFKFKNYGKHPAKITHLVYFASIADGVPSIHGEPPNDGRAYASRPFVEIFDVGQVPIVGPGEYTQVFTARGDHAPLDFTHALPDAVTKQRRDFYILSVMPDQGAPKPDGKSIHFWLIGSIKYIDIFDTTNRETQFGVYLANPFHTLAEYPDPAYNYQK